MINKDKINNVLISIISAGLAIVLASTVYYLFYLTGLLIDRWLISKGTVGQLVVIIYKTIVIIIYIVLIIYAWKWLKRNLDKLLCGLKKNNDKTY
jgi:hypothetical protein